MRDWHIGSFTWNNNFDTRSLHKLDEFYFSDMLSMSKDQAEFFENMRNVLVKYGFMQYSRDMLRTTIQGKQIETSYYLINFISYTKAFLDGIAIVLNQFYGLNKSGGEIDLKHGNLIKEIESKDSILGEYLKNNFSWIQDVVTRRDEVIHRKSPLHVYRNTPKSDGHPKDLIVKMTVKPVTFFHTEENAINVEEQDIIEFCEKWLHKSEEMIETLSASLLRNPV